MVCVPVHITGEHLCPVTSSIKTQGKPPEGEKSLLLVPRSRQNLPMVLLLEDN